MKISSTRLKFKNIDLPKSARNYVTISLLISCLTSVASFVYLPVSQPVLPLFYSLSESSQQLAPKLWLLIFPALVWLLNIIHLILLAVIKEYDEVLLKLFGLFTVLVQLLLLIDLLRIIYLTI